MRSWIGLSGQLRRVSKPVGGYIQTGIRTMASALIGQPLPSDTLMVFEDGAKAEKSVEDLFKGRKVAVCGVPGGFTPTCDEAHLPSFIKDLPTYAEKGVDVACLSVNDLFVQKAWAKSLDILDKVQMLSDGNGAFVEKMGISFDTGKFGGIRAKRFSMYVDDGIVKALNVEDGGAYTDLSSSETLLKQIE